MTNPQPEQQRFIVRGQVYGVDDAGLQEALAAVYGSEERPRCDCVPGGIEMYVARHHHLVAKRMPGTRARHHPLCPSYELQEHESGLGALMGQAVLPHGEDQVVLRVNFALSRASPRAQGPREPGEAAAVDTHSNQMSMRALMHYLFEQAGFNRWYPAMQGRRHQGTLHKYLLEAATRIQVKGLPLSERLYVPEPFVPERKDAIAQRRRQHLAFLEPQEQEGKERTALALILGEYRDCMGSPSGTRRLTIKHMPDLPLQVRESGWTRLMRRYGALLNAREGAANGEMRLLLLATADAVDERTLQLRLACMMLTSPNWIPVDAPFELPLLAALTEQQRRFVKPLRYDAATIGRFPNVLLLDTGREPTPLHVLSPFSTPREIREKRRALADNPNAWVWRTGQSLPPLPPRGDPPG